MERHTAPASARSRIVSTVVLAGVTVAILGFLPTLVVQGAIGASPVTLFQAIASNIEGPRAYEGGAATCLFGGLLLLLLSVGAAALFVAASRRWPALIEHYLLAGVVYGLMCYLVTRFALLPLGDAARTPVTAWSMVMSSLTVHLALFGLPIAVVTRLEARRVRWSRAAGRHHLR